MQEDILNLTYEELERRVKALGAPSYRARQIFSWLYQQKVTDFSLMRNLPADWRDQLKSVFTASALVLEETQVSRDETVKFLFKLGDGAFVESVLIPARPRLTLCVSSQVGCRYHCAFCASGKTGFQRDLTAGEIVGQWTAAACHDRSLRISNVVFMGIGEPLDNYENVVKAIRILNDERGIGLGARKIAVSTCGLPGQIERLSKEGLQLEISISLHAATDQKRSQIMPINKKFPLSVLLPAVRRYAQVTKRKPTFEYALLGGYNTSLEDAQALSRLLKGWDARVNLIPWHEGPGCAGFQAPAKLEVLFFKNFLMEQGVDVTLRASRGYDIQAACGQLRAQRSRKP